MHCFLSLGQEWGGDSPAELCGAGNAKLTCRTQDKAQHYTDERAKAPWPILVQRQISHSLCSAALAHRSPKGQPCFKPGCARDSHLQLLTRVVLLICSNHEVCVFFQQCVLNMPGGKGEEMRGCSEAETTLICWCFRNLASPAVFHLSHILLPAAVTAVWDSSAPLLCS